MSSAGSGALDNPNFLRNGSLYLRKWSLVVTSSQAQTDLSALRFKFRSTQSDVDTPNSLYVRVYNPSKQTIAQLRLPEFNTVSLNAGYQNGPYGLVFSGTVIQYKSGRESQTDTYLDIIAADADLGMNWATVNVTLAPGATQEDQATALLAAYAKQGVSKGSLPPFTGPALPRGKVLFGLAREGFRDLAISAEARSSVNRGNANVIPLSSYIQAEAVVLNSESGLIGFPKQTADGIEAVCLLNPNIEIGQPVKINNADIQQAELGTAISAQTQNASLPFVSADGLYRVLVAEHEGDTRGQPWYSHLTCLSIDPTAGPAQSVSQYP